MTCASAHNEDHAPAGTPPTDGTIRKQVGHACVPDPLKMMEELSAMLRRMKLPLDQKNEHIRKTVGQPR